MGSRLLVLELNFLDKIEHSCYKCADMNATILFLLFSRLRKLRSSFLLSDVLIAHAPRRTQR
jgi:hypothetical protein